MRCAIHRNLTPGKWVVSSVKQTRNGERKDKRLHTVDFAALTDVTFVTCSQKSIERIQRNIKDKSVSSGREVVAYAIGDWSADSAREGETKVSWNPLYGNDFYTASGVVTDSTFSYASFADCMKVSS